MRYGSQTPTRRIVPDSYESHGHRAVEILRKAGRRPYPWQRMLLDDWMGMDEGGSWAAPTCGAMVSRQNGKTEDVVGRIAAGMLLYGEWVVYTSHLQKTSTETFESLRAVFDSPALRKQVKDVKSALGREEIVLLNGARCKFLARTRNGGRGQHGDLLVIDEAQEYTDEQQGSFLPLLSASANPQTIYLGTPPDENAPGEVFNEVRRSALSDNPGGICWAEWSTEEIGDVSDRDRWYAANPSLGHRIREATVAAEFAQMKPDRFARERLGWWPLEAKTDSVNDPKRWESLRTDSPPTTGTECYGVKFSADGRIGCIAVCLTSEGNPPHIEIAMSADTSQGVRRFVEFLDRVVPKAAQVVVDGKGHAGEVAESVAFEPRQLIQPRVFEVCTANEALANAVKDGAVTHFGQRNLTDSMTKTRRRKIAKDGGWGYQSTEGGEAIYAEAASLAFWASRNTKRDPFQIQEVF